MGKLRYTGTLLRHLVNFAKENRAYWILPLAIVLLAVIGLVVVSQASAPFIYTLF